jgi:hypothetical protein
MQIYRVAPQDPSSSLWKQNMPFPDVFVRASSLPAAQLLGVGALEDCLAEVPGGETRFLSHEWVACEPVNDSPYSTIGAPEILEPAGYIAFS